MPSQPTIASSEITSEKLYHDRRAWLRAAVLAGSVAATGGIYRLLNPVRSVSVETSPLAELVPNPGGPEQAAHGYYVDEPLTPLEWVTNYNNFYEFTTSKTRVAAAAADFVTRPWTITVDGLVHRPKVFDLDEILRLSPPEERVYRMRCVEAWSMVIPWAGLPLAKLLEAVEPMGDAKYVAFETLYDPDRMPGQQLSVLDWPYVEGLRLDEALHPLTLLATGVYGRELPAPNGAPLRLVVPWKYGFKGIKSIVRITLAATRPPTTWNSAAPHEYGFYANVNPDVAHPRWSQATEQRIGESGRRETLLFNGYADQVAHLYQGIDLRRQF